MPSVINVTFGYIALFCSFPTSARHKLEQLYILFNGMYIIQNTAIAENNAENNFITKINERKKKRIFYTWGKINSLNPKYSFSKAENYFCNTYS